MVHTSAFEVKTRGNSDIINITDQINQAIIQSALQNGICCVFVVGSTAGITTVEYEPGLVRHDLPKFYEKLAPKDEHYDHEATWHDDNGHSHILASMIGPSITIPFVKGELRNGTWQQIVICDFDTSGRSREVIIQVIGE